MQIYKSGSDLGAHFAKFKRYPFLKSFDDKYLKEMLNSSKLVIYDNEERILKEGTLDYKIYVLFSGRAKVVKDNETVAMIDQVGDIFGELSILNDEPRTASIYAVGTVWCLVIGVSFIRKLQPDERNACYAVLYHLFAKIIAERLRATTEELVEVKQELEELRQKLKVAAATQQKTGSDVRS